MKTTILTDEMHTFLTDLLSHDADTIRDLFDNREDTDVLMAATVEALMGENPQAHAFHGTRESYCESFVIDTDRSLDEGPSVLTARSVGENSDPFMGWWGGTREGKFVEVPQHLARCIVDILTVALDATDAASNLLVDDEDIETLALFAQAVNRCAPADEQATFYQPPRFAWTITGPYGVEWEGEAQDEIEALDKWADGMEMERYSDAIKRNVLEGDGVCVFRIDGVMNATHSNYNVVIERKQDAPQEQVDREITVRLNVAIAPSDERTADDVTADILKALGNTDGDILAAVDAAVVNVSADEV